MSPFFSALVIVALAEGVVSAVDRDDDDRPVAEPAADERGKYLWWNDARSLSVYQAGKVLDLGKLGRSLGLALGIVAPREAANVDALDEVPDSTWFTNRHGRDRLSADELRRGPNRSPPSPEGALVVRSGKTAGETPGFVAEDPKGDRYLLKFDPPDLAEMATGAEQVASKIVWALGWNVPEYHLVLLDPARLEIGPGAKAEDAVHREHPMTRADLEAILARAARRPDGTIRASASRLLPGTPKGPFLFEGVRADDPNDTVPHEDRRDLRGFRIVAAWIHHTDFRPVNTLDTFVRTGADDEQALGHLVHWVLDFSSALGSGDLEWKPPKLGQEYVFDPRLVVVRAATLGFWTPSWETAEPVHPALGYFEAARFDPERWVTNYPNPLFDAATVRDSLWGAKLVAAVGDEDLAAIVATGEWSDRRAAELLLSTLRERRARIARTYFDGSRIAPLDGFHVSENGLECVDLGVSSGVVDAADAVFRYRTGGGGWTRTPACHVPLAAEAADADVEVQASHDRGADWSPAVRVRTVRDAAGLRLASLERETHP